MALGAELGRCHELIGTTVSADVAILFDWENQWAMDAGPLPSAAVRTLPQIRAFYAALFERRIAVDLAHPEADLSRYRMVVAPTLYLATDRAAENLERFVGAGGTLVMTFFSGIVDRNDHIRSDPAPSPFSQLLGLQVPEFAPQIEGQTVGVRADDGTELTGTLWTDVVRLTGAEPIATFTEDYYAGRPAITRHRAGEGTAMYVATMLDGPGIGWLMDRACDAAGIRAWTGLPPGVETVRRSDDATEWLFVLNHTPAPVEVPLDSPGVDILTGTRCETAVGVAAPGVAIVRSDRPRGR